RRALLATDVSGALRIPYGDARRLAALPSPVGARVSRLRGQIGFEAFVKGSVEEPAVALRLRTHDLHHDRARRVRERPPIDLDVMASYHAHRGRFDAWIRRDDRDIGRLEGELAGDLPARLLGRPHEPFTGSLAAIVEALPLDSMPLLGGSV